MRNRRQRQVLDDSFDPVEWPDAQLNVDDDAFARAIAHGRDAELAA